MRKRWFLWLWRRDLNPRPLGYEYLGNFAKVASLAWAFAILGAVLPTICRQSSKNAQNSVQRCCPKANQVVQNSLCRVDVNRSLSSRQMKKQKIVFFQDLRNEVLVFF